MAEEVDDETDESEGSDVNARRIVQVVILAGLVAAALIAAYLVYEAYQANEQAKAAGDVIPFSEPDAAGPPPPSTGRSRLAARQSRPTPPDPGPPDSPGDPPGVIPET